MLFTIYGLRVAGTEHVFLIGQTHQRLSERRSGHLERAKKMFAKGFHTPKTQVIMQALQSGWDIEIIEIDQLEAQPRYARMSDGSRGSALASEKVNEREWFWQQTYLRNQGGPMVINGEKVFSWSLVPTPQD